MLHLDVHGVLHAIGGMLVGFGNIFSSGSGSAAKTLDFVIFPRF